MNMWDDECYSQSLRSHTRELDEARKQARRDFARELLALMGDDNTSWALNAAKDRCREVSGHD